MRAGQLRHLVTLQRETTADDTAAGVTTTWVDVAVRHAEIVTAAGREFFEMKRQIPELTHQVRLRHGPAAAVGVAPGLRFLHGAIVLRIRAAMDPDGRRREMLCFCQELVQ